MPYSTEDFKRAGLYDERPAGEDCEFGDGKVIRHPEVSEKVKALMREPRGNSHGGDYSRQDSAVITALLSAGYNPSDTYATFAASPRGRDAAQRKEGHFDDYVRRTIQKALGFLGTKHRDGGNQSSNKISIDFSKKKETQVENGLVVHFAHEVEVEKTQWLWQGYIPAGKLTILAGDPGLGKSTISCDIISRITRGARMPTENRSVTGMCLVASAEDAPEDTIVPRLVAAEANLKRVGIIREIRQADEVGESESRYLSFPRDLTLIRDYLSQTGCRMLIIDPLNAFLEKGTDTYKDQDMRLVLHPLEDIAHETGASILVIAHLNKKEDSSTLYRIGGSIGFIGAARSVLAVTRLEDGTRVLYSLKCNIAARPASLAYETKQVVKHRANNGQWVGEDQIHSSSIRWLGEVAFDPFVKAQSATPEGKVSEEAVEFLRQVLEDAIEMPADVIAREARAAGIAKPYLNKARTALGVKATKKQGVWVWTWPEGQ